MEQAQRRQNGGGTSKEKAVATAHDGGKEGRNTLKRWPIAMAAAALVLMSRRWRERRETAVVTAREERRKRWADCDGPGEEECYRARKQQTKSLRVR